MTSTEIITLVSTFFVAVLGPTIAGILTYRQVLAKLAIDKDTQEKEARAQAEAEENERLKIIADAPSRDASTSQVLSSTMRNVVETLRKEIQVGNEAALADRKRYTDEIELLRKEISVRDASLDAERAQSRKEVQALRNEIQDLKLKISEQAHGIELLTEQVTKHNEAPAYRKKTGPLYDDRSRE